MREIKFRAWDKINKIMHYDIQIYDSLAEKISRPNEYGIMQFTGLHDKNGKEIYEGDIVNCYVEDIKNTSPVVFSDGCFCVKATNNDPDYIPCLCTVDTNQTLEIIGNIYENPELLKD